MSIYKKATQQRLRINTNVGSLSVEQLYDLTVTDLDTLAVSLEKEYKESGGKSFLDKKKAVKDANLKLRFDIVLDVLETKVKIAETASKAYETKAHNQKILGLIAEAQDGELKGKSVKELEDMLK